MRIGLQPEAGLQLGSTGIGLELRIMEPSLLPRTTADGLDPGAMGTACSLELLVLVGAWCIGAGLKGYVCKGWSGFWGTGD